jgi:hypothetical protein
MLQPNGTVDYRHQAKLVSFDGRTHEKGRRSLVIRTLLDGSGSCASPQELSGLDGGKSTDCALQNPREPHQSELSRVRLKENGHVDDTITGDWARGEIYSAYTISTLPHVSSY